MPAVETQHDHWAMGTRGFSPKSNKSDRSVKLFTYPSYGTKVKNENSYASALPYALVE